MYGIQEAEWNKISTNFITKEGNTDFSGSAEWLILWYMYLKVLGRQ